MTEFNKSHSSVPTDFQNVMKSSVNHCHVYSFCGLDLLFIPSSSVKYNIKPSQKKKASKQETSTNNTNPFR